MNEELKDIFQLGLKDALVKGRVLIYFTKSDGSYTDMIATLSPDLLPPVPVVEAVEGEPVPVKKPRKVNPDVLPVYSTDREGWRSVKLDSIISWKAI